MKDYNIKELFEIAFGIGHYAMFRPESVGSKPIAPDFNYTGIEVVPEVAEASRISHLGTPIMFPIKFRGDKYNQYTDQGELERVQVADFFLPPATLVNFRQAKILQQTNALASGGSVKEMYGFNDWVIDIRGLCLQEKDRSAYDQHLQINEFAKLADSIKVEADLFDDKGINNIVIKECDFKQVQGKPGVIPFFLRCVSDKPIELDLL